MPYVATEPALQPISAETFRNATANTADDARLDVKARGLWCRGQDAYFDVRVFYPNASSYRSLSLSSAYKRHEDTKKREYGQRVRDVEHGVFIPLVLTSTGGMGREATVFYKRLADLRTLFSLGSFIQFYHSLASMSFVLCLVKILHSVHTWKQVFCAQAY